jgi:hypothetical protein
MSRLRDRRGYRFLPKGRPAPPASTRPCSTTMSNRTRCDPWRRAETMWTCSPLRFHMHRPHPRINPLPGRAGAIDLPQPGTRKRHCRAGAVTPCPVSAARQVWAMDEGPLQRNAGRDRGAPCRVGIDQAGRVRQAIGGHLNPGRQRSSDRDRAARSTFGIPAAGKSSNDPLQSSGLTGSCRSRR